ncbi:purine and uridine phosphorylase [Thozetella sp. PMI_491]|nr:purine and uridine phosphorylase [Thozetella sp. PMI_491]
MYSSTSKQKSLRKDDYTVGWIAALASERAAAEAMLDEEHDKPSDFTRPPTDNNSYSWGRIGVHSVVIAALPAGMYGQVPATAVAKDMVSSFPNIRAGLMVGIGGGIPQLEKEIDIRLGDIVVSEPSGQNGGVVQYDAGKATAAGFELKGFLAAPPAALLNAVTKLKARHERQEPRISKILQDMLARNVRMGKARAGKPSYTHQGSEHDQLFRSGYGHIGGKTCSGCDTAQEIDRDERDTTDPEIFYGLIASGNAVIKNAADRAEVIRRLSDCLCVETEAAGLMNNFPCLVIRGICDYADAHKNDRWQPYAAATAAAYAKELLGVLDGGEIASTRRVAEVLDGINKTLQGVNQTIKGLSRGRYNDQIEKWLSPADPSTNYNESLKKRHRGTGQWLLQDARYSRWKKEPSSFLWLNGIPGCGKTVLSSTVIQDLESDKAVNTILYFYFAFTDTAKQALDHALRTLIIQLYHSSQSDIGKYLDICFISHDNGRKQPSLDTLCRTLDEMVLQTREVWIVLDALDECLSKDRRRERLLEWVCDFYDRHRNIHLLATSRPEHDIQKAITEHITTESIIPLQSAPVEKDISLYIQHEVRNRTGLQRWEGNRKIQQEIESALTKKAGGMFRWVFCQLETLELCLDYPAVQKVLSSLPETLDETYRRILDNLPRSYLEKATRLLQFLAFSERPLRIDEAVDILAVDCKQKRERFKIENRMPRPDEMVRYCGSLVVIADGKVKGDKYRQDKPARVIQLAHFSVQTYLLSEHVDDAIIKNIQATRREPIAEICLTYLLEIDILPIHILCSAYPLAPLAAECWAGQVTRLGERSRIIDHLILELLTTRLKFRICYQLYAPDFPRRGGHDETVQILLENGADINAQGGYYGNALQAASYGGHVEIIQILVENGADINAQGGHYGNTLQAASLEGHIEIAASFRGHVEIIQILVENGADKEKDGNSQADKDTGEIQGSVSNRRKRRREF